MLSSVFRDKVMEYLESAISLRELLEWVVPKSEVYLLSHESAEADLFAAIELGIAELDAELRTEHEVRSFLLDTLREYKTISAALSSTKPQQSEISGSSNRTYWLSTQFPQHAVHWMAHAT